MTIRDMRCDICGVRLSGLYDGVGGQAPTAGTRFSYHPGDPAMRDDSGVLCTPCWLGWTGAWGDPEPRTCATCGTPVPRRASLFVRRWDQQQSWQLCTPHAADLLNTLRTVEPKFDRATFRLPLDPTAHHRSEEP
jgi:hypothetical protein